MEPRKDGEETPSPSESGLFVLFKIALLFGIPALVIALIKVFLVS